MKQKKSQKKLREKEFNQVHPVKAMEPPRTFFDWVSRVWRGRTVR